MREKYYVRKDGEVAGIQYTPPARGRVGSVMLCGNTVGSRDHMQALVDVLFISKAERVELDSLEGSGTPYKRRLFVVGVSPQLWAAFIGNLRVRGYAIDATRRFGRLAR